jgi:hypothetical protein
MKNNALITRYKKYRETGGIIQTKQNVDAATGAVGNIIQTGLNAALPGAGSIFGAISSIGNSVVDGFDKKDENGVGSLSGAIAKGSFTAGPIGMAIAAATYKKMKVESMNISNKKRMEERRMQEADLMARKSEDPGLLTGNQNVSYYKYGGNISNNVPSSAGNPLSSTAVEFKGPSHSNGGIQLPNMNAEVEGNETVNAGYVFSDRLGFAKLHKPIAKAIGKIEGKATRPERINSLKLLKKKEHNLQQAQEYVRSVLGIKD